MTDEKIKIETEFANAAYKSFMSVRFGLTPCCYYDLESIKIKRDACSWEELKNTTLTRTDGLISQLVTCDNLA
jgi:hypothetical protein